MLRETLLDLKEGSRGQITLRTAMDTAANLTSGVFAPIFGQIDPLRLGEDTRSTKIIREYGDRLVRKSRNLKKGGLEYLVSGYPSHQFEIDREEAGELFHNVREPTEEETKLIEVFKIEHESLKSIITTPSDKSIIVPLSKGSTQEGKHGDHDKPNNQSDSNAEHKEASPNNRGPQTGSRRSKQRKAAGNIPTIN